MGLSSYNLPQKLQLLVAYSFLFVNMNKVEECYGILASNLYCIATVVKEWSLLYVNIVFFALHLRQIRRHFLLCLFDNNGRVITYIKVR